MSLKLYRGRSTNCNYSDQTTTSGDFTISSPVF